MGSVGVKELKAHLSEYLTMARNGERVIVTDRGREIAEIVPISRERKVMLELISSGRLKWDGRKPSGLTGVAIRGGAVADTVIEDRR